MIVSCFLLCDFVTSMLFLYLECLRHHVTNLLPTYPAVVHFNNLCDHLLHRCCLCEWHAGWCQY